MRLGIYAVGGLALAALGATVLLSGGKGATAAGLFRPDDPEIITAGETLYDEYCASCHGATLEGEANWRTRRDDGRLPAPPHDETGHTWHHTDQQLFMLTKYGVAALVGDGYESDMNGFGDALSDDEIIAVLSYIKSRWPTQIRDRHDEMNAAAAAAE